MRKRASRLHETYLVFHKSRRTFWRLLVYQSPSPPLASICYCRVEYYSYDERAEGHRVGASRGISSFQRASLDSQAYESAYSSITLQPQDVYTMSTIASCLGALVEFFRVSALATGPGKCPRGWRAEKATGKIGRYQLEDGVPPTPPPREGVLPFGDSLLNFGEDSSGIAVLSPGIGGVRPTRATSSSHPSSSPSARSSEIPREFDGEFGPSTMSVV